MNQPLASVSSAIPSLPDSLLSHFGHVFPRYQAVHLTGVRRGSPSPARKCRAASCRHRIRCTRTAQGDIPPRPLAGFVVRIQSWSHRVTRELRRRLGFRVLASREASLPFASQLPRGRDGGANRCRLHGIEVVTLSDANHAGAGAISNRRKGSRDDVARWTPDRRAACRSLRPSSPKTRTSARTPRSVAASRIEGYRVELQDGSDARLPTCCWHGCGGALGIFTRVFTKPEIQDEHLRVTS